MKVLVTGGFGFIGSHIVDFLLAENHDVIILDNLSSGKRVNVGHHVSFYNLDIGSENLEQVFMIEMPEYLIHHAAQVSVAQSLANPVIDATTNVLGTINLLSLSVKYKVKKFIFASSCAVYGNTDKVPLREDDPLYPASFYGCSKLSSEKYIHSFSLLHGLPYIIFRYANVYGPRQSVDGEGGVVCTFVARLLDRQPLIIHGDGRQSRDFIYVRDVARANVLALRQGKNKIINIGSGKQKRIQELYQTLTTFVPNSTGVQYLPARQGDIRQSCLDSKKAKHILGWKPQTTFEKGLQLTIEYYKRAR